MPNCQDKKAAVRLKKRTEIALFSVLIKIRIDSINLKIERLKTNKNKGRQLNAGIKHSDNKITAFFKAVILLLSY